MAFIYEIDVILIVMFYKLLLTKKREHDKLNTEYIEKRNEYGSN